MIDEEENEVERYNEDGEKIPPNEPWSPTGSEEELLIEILEPTVVTSILVTDEVKKITFKISYKPEDSDEFVDYVDESGQAEVRHFGLPLIYCFCNIGLCQALGPNGINK